MKRAVFIVLLTLLILASVLNAVVHAWQESTTTSSASPQQEPKAANDNQSLEQQRLDFERQKFAVDTNLENEKIKLEREKLEAERSKIPWTAFSAVVPLLAVLFTVGYSIWSFRKQSEQQNEQRREDAKQVEKQRVEDAKLQFEMKAAEIAFMGETPLAVRDRAKALKVMFDNRLPNNFLSDYDPYKLGEREGNIESKKFFLELMLKYPEQQFETLCFWKELFPGDVEWLIRIHLSPHKTTKKPEESRNTLQPATTIDNIPAATNSTITQPPSEESGRQPSKGPSHSSSSDPNGSAINNENRDTED